MIPHQNPRNFGRTQPSAMQFSQAGSFLSNRKSPASRPDPAAANPANSAFRANVRPDFAQQSTSAAQTAPTGPEKPHTISDQYNLAREQLKSPVPLAGNATEKQRRDYAWEVRSDPMKAAETIRQYERMYGPSVAQSQPQRATPVRHTNFNGPRRTFGP